MTTTSPRRPGGAEAMREAAAKVAAGYAHTKPDLERSSNASTAMVIAAIMSDTGAKIEAAIRALPLPAGDNLSTGGWKPIETSPRAEGTYADIWNGAPYNSRVPNASLRKGQWCTYDAEWGYDPVPNPTHWMPLPEPPPGE